MILLQQVMQRVPSGELLKDHGQSAASVLQIAPFLASEARWLAGDFQPADLSLQKRRLHIRFSITARSAGNFLQSCVEFPVMAVVAAVDAEDDETRRQTAEQFVVVQFM